jgi:hypothetical protein
LLLIVKIQFNFISYLSATTVITSVLTKIMNVKIKI